MDLEGVASGQHRHSSRPYPMQVIFWSLCFEHAAFAEADLVEMMSLIPSLYEISLSVHKPPPMKLHGRRDFTAEAFVTMITSRWSCDSAGAGELASNPSYPAARLMIADVEFNDAINKKAKVVLKECPDGGLDFPH